MNRREFSKGCCASLLAPVNTKLASLSSTVLKDERVGEEVARRDLVQSSAVDAMTRFLETLGPDEWGQPANTAASAIYYSADTGAADYDATVAEDNRGTSGPNSNWIVWGAGAHDTILNRGIIGPTGLHYSYCGNEGYAFDFANLTWHRMRTPDDYTRETKGGICSLGSSNSPKGYLNGDPAPLHTYSELLFLREGAKGILWMGAANPVHVAYMLDLSKGYPYHFPTTLGVPNSGWKSTALVPAGWDPTTPSVQGYDRASKRIFILNTLIGGGPPPMIIYDIERDTWSHNESADLMNWGAGCTREGHRELWAVGPAGATSSHHQSVIAVSMLDARRVAGFTPKTFSQYPNLAYPGIAYCAPIDSMVCFFGGNTLQIINCATKIATNYVTGGTVLPPNISSVNGVGTRFWCDLVHHCFLMSWDGNSNIYVLKTSLF